LGKAAAAGGQARTRATSRPARWSDGPEAQRDLIEPGAALQLLAAGDLSSIEAAPAIDSLQHVAGNAAVSDLLNGSRRHRGREPTVVQTQSATTEATDEATAEGSATEGEKPSEEPADVTEAVDDMAAGIEELESEDETLFGERITITPELLALTHPSFAKKDATPKIDDWTVEGYGYSTVRGSAFKKQTGDLLDISPDDVEQGVLGDCYLLSAMAAVARANPDAIRRLISGPDEKNKYSVTIYVDTGGWFKKSLTPKVVKVDPYVPTSGGRPVLGRSPMDPGWTDEELWVLLIEKAYASVRGDYETIEGGFGAPAMEALTGQSSTQIDTGDYTEIQIASTIQVWLDMKYAVTASADWYARDKYKEEARKKGIILEHEYSVMRVDKSRMTIDLQNPWGIANEPILDLPIADFKKYFRNFAGNPVSKR
jgi:hypothetical protein